MCVSKKVYAVRREMQRVVITLTVINVYYKHVHKHECNEGIKGNAQRRKRRRGFFDELRAERSECVNT